MTDYTLPLPWPKPPIRSNDRDHYRVSAPKIREVRTGVTALARFAKLPKGLDRVEATIYYQPATHQRQDVGSISPVLKAALDGLVDYGMFPDDDSRHVIAETCRFADVRPDAGGTDSAPRLWLVIRDVSGQTEPEEAA